MIFIIITSCRIPKSEEVKSKWFNIIGKVVPAWSRVCSEHFSNEDYVFNNKGEKWCLKYHAIPSLNLPIDEITDEIRNNSYMSYST